MLGVSKNSVYYPFVIADSIRNLLNERDILKQVQDDARSFQQYPVVNVNNQWKSTGFHSAIITDEVQWDKLKTTFTPQKNLYLYRRECFQRLVACKTDVNHTVWINIPAKAERTGLFAWISSSEGYKWIQAGHRHRRCTFKKLEFGRCYQVFC